MELIEVKMENDIREYIKKPVIIVADDDRVVRRIISDFLQNEGYIVIEADNGKQALKAFKSIPVDLILLDILMPGENGIEACKKIRQMTLGEYIPIIMITAFEGNEHVESVFSVGADDFISKPINKTILQHRVKRLIKAERNRKKLESLAYYDNLTQAYNREVFFTKFAEEFEKAQEEDYSIGVILADIDKFKDINDIYGHAMGDTVLKKIVKTIKINLRKSDFLGRYGGDEFIICLPKVSLRQLHKIAERIRASLDRINIELSSNEVVTVTGSFGLNLVKPTEIGYSNDILENALKQADENLYTAKKTGRNKIVE